MLPCIAPGAALLNHSCEPNCSFEGTLVGGVPAVRVFSEVAIPAGAELTISYVIRSLPLEERARRLREGYGICACACARCADPAEGAFVARCAACGAPNPLVPGGVRPRPCPACGAPDGGGGLAPSARLAWLSRAEGAPPAALLGLEPAPSRFPSPPLLHEDDQGVFNLLYRGLGALWAAPTPLAPAIVDRVCASAALSRRGRGAGFAGDALLFAGQLCSLVAAEGIGGDVPGARAAAAAFYARARAALAAVFGEGDARVAMAERFLAVPAASRRELEEAEGARMARTANWCCRFPGLAPATVVRWCECPLPKPVGRQEMTAAMVALKALRELTARARRVAMGEGGSRG
jgi:hypothetical protein